MKANSFKNSKLFQLNINKNLILLFSLILSLFKIFKCNDILLDNQNPLQIIFPDSNQVTKMDFRFSFPENSKPLQFGQFFGIAFPKELGSDLNFDIGYRIKYDCKLTEINSNSTYIFEAMKPTAKEPNYIYCQFNDRVHNKLKVGKDIVYKLSISLNEFKISRNYIKNLWLFTSTSNNLNKIILNYSMKFGTFAIFPNRETSRNSAFNLLKADLIKDNKPLGNIYAYTKFDISLIFQSNIFLESSEFNLMIKYPKRLLTGANNLFSVDAANKTEYMGLKGNLTLTNIQEEYLQIQGINDSLIPGAKYKINLMNFIAKDEFISIGDKLEILFFYKNTYSLLGYMKTVNNFIKIIPAQISLKANHPEKFDIWRNALWPMTFKFTLSGNDLEKGGYVLLQHYNAKNKDIKWNFVASTCDFSEATGFDNGFGKRPVCYPLRTDFDYINLSNNYYPGSAVFFKVNKLNANKEIKITIWGSADNCGGNSFMDVSSKINPNQEYNFRQFNFKIFVYSRINSNKINEERLIINSLNEAEKNRNLIAQSDEIVMDNKCWNNLNIIGPDKTPVDYKTMTDINEQYYKNWGNNIKINNADPKKGYTSDINLFKEFYNFQLSKETISNPTNKANSYLKDITSNPNNYQSAFIYGENNLPDAKSYFSLRLPFLSYMFTHSYYPFLSLPLNFSAGTFITNAGPLPGRLQFLFSKNWFEKGDESCYISWGLSCKDDPNALKKDKTLIIDDSTSQTNSKNNWISNNPNNPNGWMDMDKSCLFKQSGCPKEELKIVSKFNSGMVSTSNQFMYFNDAGTEIAAGAYKSKYIKNYAYFYTPCLKWKKPELIKSIYSYFDFQVQWLYSTDAGKDGYPNRNLRMVKLFPEAGVFNDNTSSSKLFNPVKKANKGDDIAIRPNQVDDITFVLHYALGSSSTMTGICLIEISGKSIMSIKHQSANFLVLWIGFGVLLESDYEDLNSYYPMAPINYENNPAWGFQSAYLMNKEENLNLNPTMYQELNDQTKNNRVFRQLLNNYAKTGVDGNTEYFDYSITDNEAKIPDNIFTNESSYYFLMGSNIYIKESDRDIISILPGENSLRNLLVPIYCPIKNNDIYFGNGLPTLYMATINSGAYDNISGVNKIFSVNINENAKSVDELTENKKAIYSVIVTSPRSGSKNTLYRSLNNQVMPEILDKSKFNNYFVTLRWALYGSSSPLNSDNYAYLYIGGKSAQEANSEAPESFNSAHIFLVKNDVTVNEKLFKSSFDGFINNYKGFDIHGKERKFYYLGKKYSHAIFVSHKTSKAESNNMLKSPLTEETSKNYFVGIKRPLIDTYYSEGKFTHAYDKIGYFGVDKKSKEGFSNYIFFNSYYEPIFLLDYNRPTTNTKFQITITSDKAEKIYKKDVGANLRINAIAPNSVNIPGGASFNFSFKGTIVNQSTICGMIDKKNIVKECLINSENLISCISPSARPKFEVCCYNISYLGMVTSDSIILNSLNVTVPPYPSTYFSNFYSTDIFKEKFPNKSYWNTQQSSSEDLISFKKAEISEIKYSHVIQDKGIGKVKFTIELPRELNRNMLITIYGNLKEMYIPNSTPRCVVNTGSTLDSGDILLENCDISSLGNSVNGIKIYTKNKIYNCGLSFSKKLNVYIWPIKILNFRLAPYSKENMKVLVNMNNPTNDNLVFNNQSFNIKDTQTYSNKPLKENIWGDLCPIKSIHPKIPGEFADYFFSLNLDSYRDILGDKIPNEFSLFFPFRYYGGIFEDVYCYNDDIPLNCSFSNQGILNIRLPKNLEIGSGNILEIRITRIFNPYIETTEDVYFPCTINSTDFSNEKRINLITGSGKLSGGISLPTEKNKMGNLRFFNFPDYLNNKNPRELSNLKLNIGFDSFDSQTNLPLTVKNNPQIIINLPSEYNLDWYTNNKLSAEVYEYTFDETEKKVKKAEKKIESIFLSQSGNKITLDLGVKEYLFVKNFEYFEITLMNLINPTFATGNKNKIWSLATKPFNIMITNSDFSSVFKNHVNTNNSKTTNLGNPLIDNWVNFYRGLSFKFDDKKWIIDVGNNKSTDMPNIININSGRYVTAYFSIKNPNINLAPKSLTVGLSDPIFKLYRQNILVTTSSTEKIPFLIGAPCGSELGKYVIDFKVIKDNTSNNHLDDFAPLNKVIVNLSNSKIGEINYINPTFVPLGGSSYIYIKISEPNFDVLNLTFQNDESVRNDPSSEISNISIPPATITNDVNDLSQTSPIFGKFTMKSNGSSKPQIFKMENPNACFKWLNKLIKIEISGKIENFPEDFDLKEKIKYIPYKENSKEFPTKNMLKFTFSPPNNPCYLYCALVCSERKFPSDIEIRNGKSNGPEQESPILKYFNSFITKNEQIDLIFNKLMRNQRYKLRCLLNSIQGDENKRTEKEIIISDYNISTSKNNDIKTQPQVTQKCVGYFFKNTKPSKALKFAMLNSCQNFYTSKGNWRKNGCMICTDSDITLIPTGYSLPDFINCGKIMNTKNSLALEDGNAQNVYRFLSEQNINREKDLMKKGNESNCLGDNCPEIFALKNHTYFENGNSYLEKHKNPKILRRLEKISHEENLRFLQEDKFFIYTICPIPFPICASDIGDNNTSITYNSLFKEFFNKFNTTENLKKNLPNFANESITLQNVYEVNDLKKVEIKNLKFNLTSYKIDGDIKWTASYSNAKVNCFWIIGDNENTYSSNDIWECLDYKKCGSFKAYENLNNFATEKKYWNPLFPSKNYAMFITCSNDVPYPSKDLLSDVAKYSFTIDQQVANRRKNVEEFIDPVKIEEKFNEKIKGSYLIFNDFAFAFIWIMSFLIMNIF